MKKYLLLFLSAIFFAGWYFSVAVPYGQPSIGYSTAPDSDADYIISKQVANGAKLYSDFSILYPPGRFLIQGMLFHLITPSFVILDIVHASMVMVFFPAVLFLLGFFVFETLIKSQQPKLSQQFTFVIAYVLAVTTSMLYLMFIRSAQEVHVITALFFILLLFPGKTTSIKKYVLGALVGFIFLFRIDGGVLLSLAIITGVDFNSLKKSVLFLRQNSAYIIGFLTVWVPMSLAILIHGSLFNFFYDTLILGLVIQPRFMSLPIPQNELGLVWLSTLIFVTASSLALFTDAQTIKAKRFALQTLAVFMTLSYVSALGRSDEPHLWYGVIWITLSICYVLYRICVICLKKELKLSKDIIIKTLVLSLIFFGYSWLVLALKAPSFFLGTVLLLFVFSRYIKFPIISVLLAGVFTSLLVFHSVSYLSLRFTRLRFPPRGAFSYDWITSEGTELGGMKMFQNDELILTQIRKDIPKDEKYLFIFPKNILIGEYLHTFNPTRYVILANERSDRTEREVINQLNQTNTAYFLIFPESAKLREGQVWDWILTHTQTVKIYSFSEENAELRVRVSAISCGGLPANQED